MPVLLALHGAGGAASEFARRWMVAADHGWLVGVPQSSQLLSAGRHGWVDRERALIEVGDHYRTMVSDYQADHKGAVIAGFSQGGTVAIWAGITGALPVYGVIGVACAPTDLDEAASALDRISARKIRFSLIVGDRDYIHSQAVTFAGMLDRLHIPVRLEVVAGLKHELPKDLEQSIVASLEFISV